MRSQVTNTPLQAMTLLNDVTYVEAARHLAHRILVEGGTATSDRAVLRHGTCHPAASQQKLNSRFCSVHWVGICQFIAPIRMPPHSCLGTEILPPAATTQPVVHAAWTQVALMLLNLDETITKQ